MIDTAARCRIVESLSAIAAALQEQEARSRPGTQSAISSLLTKVFGAAAATSIFGSSAVSSSGSASAAAARHAHNHHASIHLLQ